MRSWARIRASRSASGPERPPRGERPFRPGVLELLTAAHAEGLRLAIASTTTAANVSALLRVNLRGTPQLAFDVVVCGDMVPQKKPAPDIYRLALANLRLAPESCIAFEDSPNGVRAAAAAGLVTVLTPSRWNIEEAFPPVALNLPSLEGLDVARLRGLLGATHAAA